MLPGVFRGTPNHRIISRFDAVRSRQRELIHLDCVTLFAHGALFHISPFQRQFYFHFNNKPWDKNSLPDRQKADYKVAESWKTYTSEIIIIHIPISVPLVDNGLLAVGRAYETGTDRNGARTF